MAVFRNALGAGFCFCYCRFQVKTLEGLSSPAPRVCQYGDNITLLMLTLHVSGTRTSCGIEQSMDSGTGFDMTRMLNSLNASSASVLHD